MAGLSAEEQNPVSGTEGTQTRRGTTATYIRLWTTVGSYILFCAAVRLYATKETALSIDVLVPCILITVLSLHLGDWLYIKLNNQNSPNSLDKVPWTRRRLLNGFLSNTAATFVSQGTLTFNDLISGFILFQVGIFLQGATDNVLGSSPQSHRSRLTHILAYLAVAVGANAVAPPALASTAFYFVRVYLRATFNATVDVLFSLLTSSASRRNRLTSLLLLLPAVSVVTLLLFQSRFLCPNCICPPNLYNVVYTSACYSQVRLSDPRALHKTIACAEEHNLRQSVFGPTLGPVEARLALFNKAESISRSCSPMDISRAWSQACLSATGAERGHQFGSGVSSSVVRTFWMLRSCTAKFGLDDFGIWGPEAALAMMWGKSGGREGQVG
jgi:hypothetical protein